MGLNIAFSPAATLFCGLVILWIVKTITSYAKLRQFQGPRWTGISNWPHSLALLRHNCHEWYAEVNNKYGMFLSWEEFTLTSHILNMR
jgi:hypothetical protein